MSQQGNGGANRSGRSLDRRTLVAMLGGTGAAAALTGPIDAIAAGKSTVHDVVIRGGRVIDGSGLPAFEADIGISNSRFAEIGEIPAKGRKEINASGLIVSAGWIDSMDQSGSQLRRHGSGGSKVQMGLTTLIAGEAGTPVPAAEISDYFNALETQGIAVNFATYYSAAQARRAVIGANAGRANPAQLAQMSDLVDQAMRAGVLGLATALIYPPTSYMNQYELTELAKAVGKYKGIYATHMRDEGEFVLSAIDEAIEIGRDSGSSVHIYHLKAAFAPQWGGLMHAIGARIATARSQGLDVFADVYPYAAAGTYLQTTIPNWMFSEGTAKAKQRLRDPKIRRQLKRELKRGSTTDWTNFVYNAGGWDKVVLGQPGSAKYVKYSGKTITEIASIFGRSPDDMAWDIVLDEGDERAMAFYFMMSEADIETALRFPWTSVGSDAGVRYALEDKGYPHPRGYGTFPRIISEYVRKRKILSLEEAIRKMTSLPATNLRLAERGQIKVGNWADVTIFDYDTIEDRATYEKPIALPVGIHHVLVNGVPIMLDGTRTPARPGKVIRGPGARAG